MLSKSTYISRRILHEVFRKVANYILGCLRVKYFPLPIGDMNSPSYNKFTEGIDFFQQATQTLGRALKS